MRLVERIGDLAHYCALRWRNQPEYFPSVQRTEDDKYILHGTVVDVNPVGPVQKIGHFRDGEIALHLVSGRLTDLRYLRGLPVNAVHEVSYEMVGDCAVTTFQPLHVKPLH